MSDITRTYKKYLDPKNDLTFRKIFGEHPHILKSFLNSVLPLEEDQYIESLEYQDPGLIPIMPELKHSIVDVRCTDNRDRQFIVEMQMYWSKSFLSRMLFNAGKAYVKQLDKGAGYNYLKPVYGLSLINDTFIDDEELFYHHYRLAHIDKPEEIIEGIELVFIELPKFKAQNFSEKKAQVLWLRFLTEINETTENIPYELTRQEEIKEALEHLQVSAFNKEELDYYEQYWDRIRTEKAALEDALQKTKKAQKEAEEAKKQAKKERKEKEEAKLQAKKERKEKEEAKKLAEKERKEKEEAKKKEEEAKKEKKQAMLKLAAKMKKYGETVEEIMKETGISREEIIKL